jgi:hypothetical protein
LSLSLSLFVFVSLSLCLCLSLICYWFQTDLSINYISGQGKRSPRAEG